MTVRNAAVMLLVVTTALLIEWKEEKAGSQTKLKALSAKELSRTTSGETARSVHTTDCCTALIVHCRNDSDASVPKNSPPLGVENDEAVELISGGITSPKTATSMRGSDGIAENNALVLAGGRADVDFDRMNRATAMARLTSLMDIKYSKITWLRLLVVP